MFEAFETLESRRLFTVTLENGVLTVTGTEQHDQLLVGRNQTMIVVSDNGMRHSFNPNDVTSIVVNGLGEADRIGIGPGLNKPITANGGDGNDYITGGTGAEHLNGDGGNDRILGGAGDDVIDGGDGEDVLVGGLGADHLLGGAGRDRIDARDHHGDDVIDGGDGEDYARIDPGDQVSNVEHVLGGASDAVAGGSGGAVGGGTVS
jgi:Ca2+-binding RTX toxin-like protein